MNVIYSEKAKQGGEGYALLQQATERLKEVVGETADPIKAEWDRREDGEGRSLYTLRLSDWSGAVSASLTPDELQSPSRLPVRLDRLWGQLPQIRSHKQLEELRKSGD
jgi:hypothetical protein